MDYQLRFLNQNQTKEIHQCMTESFADYAVDMSYMTHERMINRHIKNGIDYGMSIGAYYGDKMIGFTAVGIDEWQGQKAAFDAGTGIIKAHRGKGLAKRMFDFSEEKLVKNGIKKFVLEVLQENEPAIKAYKKTGFEVSRSLDCFWMKSENIKLIDQTMYEIRELSKTDILKFKDFTDWQPSWENSFNSIQRIPNELFINGAFHEGECIGFLVFYPHLEWIMMLAVKKEFRRKKVGSTLLNHLYQNNIKNHKVFKMYNSESKDRGFHDFAIAKGFEDVGGQFEMEMCF